MVPEGLAKGLTQRVLNATLLRLSQSEGALFQKGDSRRSLGGAWLFPYLRHSIVYYLFEFCCLTSFPVAATVRISQKKSHEDSADSYPRLAFVANYSDILNLFAV